MFRWTPNAVLWTKTYEPWCGGHNDFWKQTSWLAEHAAKTCLGGLCPRQTSSHRVHEEADVQSSGLAISGRTSGARDFCQKEKWGSVSTSFSCCWISEELFLAPEKCKTESRHLRWRINCHKLWNKIVLLIYFLFSKELRDWAQKHKVSSGDSVLMSADTKLLFAFLSKKIV